MCHQRFDPNSEEQDFHEVFSKYGTIINVQIKNVISNPQNRIAHIYFDNPTSAAQAKECLHRTAALGSASIIVDFKMNKLKDLSSKQVSTMTLPTVY